MPKWLSSILIVVGFLALIALAFLPRNIEITITTNNDNSDTLILNGDVDQSHTAPAPATSED